MEKKVLVVDDSQTIQKVVSITLAGQPYEIIPCTNESELFDRLTDETSLILLDYTLTEGKTGIDIVKTIRQQFSEVPVLMMLGTFDSLSDGDISGLGAIDKIVKPFESEKFIQKCQHLIESGSVEADVDVSSFLSRDEMVGDFESDLGETDTSIENWIVDSPRPQDNSSEIEIEEKKARVEETHIENEDENILAAEAASWSGSVPEPMGEVPSTTAQMPPVIDKSEDLLMEVTEDEEFIEEDDSGPISFSVTEDSVDSFESDELGVLDEDTSEFELSSSLVSLDDLSPEEDELDEIEKTDTDINISEELLDSLKQDSDENEFWAVDDEETQGESSPDDILISASADEDSIKEPEPLELIEDSDFSSSYSSFPEANNEELVEKLKIAVEPILEKFIREYCSQKIEQVAWEVIPDLAENLIKKELEKIAESVKPN